jgi:hypothetical protein
MEMSVLVKFRSAGVRKAWKLAFLCIGLIVLAIQFYRVYRFITIVIIILIVAPIIADNIERSALKNSRGDTVEFKVEFAPNRYDPDYIVIRLRRAHHWLLTTLLKAESYDLRYDAKWLDQNTVEITLVFGCLVRLKTPVTTVGPIHISYRLTESGRHLGSCHPGVPPHAEKLPERTPEGR